MSSEKSYCEVKQVYSHKTLIKCHRLEEKVKIKNGTKKIASAAFSSSQVKEVTLPNSIEEIEPHAFLNCPNLQRIVFGKNIRKIENDSFVNCPNIHEIVFPEDADIIHEISRPYAFHCNSTKRGQLLYSFRSLMNSIIKSENKFANVAEREMLKELNSFLDSEIPKLTVKLTCKKRSIWLPKYIFSSDKTLIENTVTSWIALGHDNEATLDLSNSTAEMIGMVVEMCILDSNKEAEMYLKNYITDIVEYLIQMGDNKALIGIIKLGLIEDDRLNSVLKILIDANNTVAPAYVLMQMKGREISVEQDLKL